jgi:RNA polymerase sigma factor (sigma-70 family)
MSINVLIVDDHKIIRQSLAAILNSTEDINVVGECSDGRDVIDLLRELNVDIVLMDILMKEQDGISTTAMIHRRFRSVKILALSMLDDLHSVQKIIQAGANGYTVKTSGSKEIIQAIRSVYNGENYLAPEISEKFMRHVSSDFNTGIFFQLSKDKIQHLTNRERDVLKLISQEKTNREIADILHISTGTVASHRKNLLRKLQVKNSIGLAKIAFSSGILD